MILDPTQIKSATIKPQTQGLSKSETSQNNQSIKTAALEQLTKITQLSAKELIGKELQAQVIKSEIAQPKQLTSLLDKLSQENTGKEQKQPLNQLLQSPVLRLVKLALIDALLPPNSNKANLLILTQLALKPGQQLPLTVNPHGQLQLGSSTEKTTATQQSLQQALRQTLPNQLPQTQLTNTLTQLSQNPLPQALENIINQLKNNLPSAQQLTTSEGAAKALSNSGLFLENKMSQLISTGQSQSASALLTSKDLKATLASLEASAQTAIQTAKQTPDTSNPPMWAQQWQKQLSERNQNNRAELTTKQLQVQLTVTLHQTLLAARQRVQHLQVGKLTSQQAGAEATTPTSGALQMEIPFVDGRALNVLKLSIEERDAQKDETQDDKKQKLWRVQLSFNVEPLGEIHARLDIQNDHLKAKLWSESDSALNKLQDAMSTLSERLDKDGVTVDELKCLKGRPALTDNRFQTQLINVKT